MKKLLLAASVCAAALALAPQARAACDEVSYVPELAEVTFSPQQLDCLEVGVSGSSTTNCAGAYVTFTNRCSGPVVFVTWKFECEENPAGCDQLAVGQAGKIAVDVVEKETETFTFDGNVGAEVVQVVVSVEIDEVTPGCSYAPSTSNTSWAAALLALAGWGLQRRRSRR